MAITIQERLDPSSYRHVPWKNGGGVTIDIAAEYEPGADPGGWQGVIWRLSRTRIEQPGPFSDLSGYDRLLAVIDGAGLMLHPKDREPIDVGKPLHAVRFAGEWPIDSELTHGPVGVLNLLADRRKAGIDLLFIASKSRANLPAADAILLALLPAQLRLDGQPTSLAADGAIRASGPGLLQVEEGLVAVALITRTALAG